MSSNNIVECPICFNYNHKFKVLDCGHEFCTQCCQTLCKSAEAENIDLNESLGLHLESTLVIECPKCRSITNIPENGVEGFKSRFVGYLACYQCDTEKLTKEFRWCHTCSRSVCSTCFIDKHANAPYRNHQQNSAAFCNKNQVMLTANFSLQYRGYSILQKPNNGNFAQIKQEQGAFWAQLPGSDKVVASTERVYTFSENCVFVYRHTDKKVFCPLFKSAYKYTQFTDLCHVQENVTTTGFYLIDNPQSKQLQIVTVNRQSNSLVSWRKIKLSLLCPEMQFIRPVICAYDTFGLFLIWDRQQTKLFKWNTKTNGCSLIADLQPQSPQVIQFYDNFMYMLLREGEMNRVERIKL